MKKQMKNDSSYQQLRLSKVRGHHGQAEISVNRRDTILLGTTDIRTWMRKGKSLSVRMLMMTGEDRQGQQKLTNALDAKQHRQ